MAREPLRDGDPSRVGRYRLTARLGAGGMGVVYLGAGMDSADGGQAAVKVLRPELADDPEFRARFGREVASLMRVSGECTVRVIEADPTSSRPFMVTEYAEGPSLSEYIDTHGPLGGDMLYALATGLAEALTAIHAAGVVHRDLKPSNVILGPGGPKVIDFGIAQTLDATSVTKTGMMVGSAGFMAPEQVTGRAGQAADIFTWAVTVAYAASGQPPFGTGESLAILYRILHDSPDVAAVPEPLQSLVVSALAKDPQQRPTAGELLDRLASPGACHDRPAPPVPAFTWPSTQPRASRWRPEESLLFEPAPPAARRRQTFRPGRLSRRMALTAGSAAAAVALVSGLLTGHVIGLGRLTANQAAPMGITTAALNIYPSQQQRGVFQAVDRVVASGRTIVTLGSQASDGLVRPQFFVSSDGGRTWGLAPLHAAGGGKVPLGHAATLLAGGPGGWLAAGPQAIWTSQDGTSWTLASTHGITPQRPGDSVWVITRTAAGFLAAGKGNAAGGGTQAVIWTSRDGLTWQRMTAAGLGLAGTGEAVQSISYATYRGDATVIAGTVAAGGATYSGAWLSTNGGSAWSRVSVPVGNGAGDTISGLAFDSAGLPGGVWRLVSSLPVVSAYPGLTGLTSVTHGPFGWLAVGVPGPVVLTSANGMTWHRAGGGIEKDLGGVSAVATAAGPAGYSVVGRPAGPDSASVADVWWSRNLTSWTKAQDMNVMSGSIQVLAVAADPHGFVSAGSHDNHPAVWTTSDGRLWTTIDLALPAGTSSAVLEQIAINGNHVAALGQEIKAGRAMPFAEQSSDGGASWRQVPFSPPGPGTVITALTADSGGFTAVGQYGQPGQQTVMRWTSATGTSWPQARVSALGGGSDAITALASSGSAVTGIGSTATMQGRRFLLLALPPG